MSYFHEMPDAIWKFLESVDATIKMQEDTGKVEITFVSEQPPWCTTPGAIDLCGCWSLLYRNIKRIEDCKNCEFCEKKPKSTSSKKTKMSKVHVRLSDHKEEVSRADFEIASCTTGEALLDAARKALKKRNLQPYDWIIRIQGESIPKGPIKLPAEAIMTLNVPLWNLSTGRVK